MISVIIPIYNVEKYLSRCMESVINQTYRNLEIILVDDGSTDSSGLMCNEYAKKDPRIIVIHQFNQGTSKARNSGLDIAKGKYIGFIDPDDVISLRFYEILYNKLMETNSDMSLCGLQDFSDINDIDISVGFLNSIEYSGKNFIKEFVYEKDTVSYVSVCNKLYKRWLWDSLRFPIDTRICEDEYVWYKCMYNSEKISIVSAKLYYYFNREGSTMNKNYGEFSFKREIAFLDALEDRINFCKENNLDKLLKRTVKLRNKILREIYITNPKDKIPDRIIKELKKNIKDIPVIKRIKIYLKDIF